MRYLLLALALSGVTGTAVAVAQTKPAATPAPGSASVKTQLQALHYGNVRDLRRGPDGQWTGKATQNGVEKRVTISPKGVVTAR
ncbi:MAG: hypothetical protein GEV13_06130 [Rhodospirillales bacterium]|nr:hypothetical protein [Rhodospirillales bacterium]